MPLPRQVESQVAAANAHFANLASDEPPPPAPPADEPVVSAAPTPPAPPVPAEEMVSVPKAKYDRDMQQFRSLQGIHRSIEAEKTALRTQVATLTSTVAALQSQVEQYQAVVTARPPLITDSEVREYTPELLDVIKRKGQEEFGPILDQLRQQVTALSQRNAQLEQALSGVNSQVQQVSFSDFLGDVRRMMPEFDAVNQDQRFVDWLKQMNPLTGRAYNVDFWGARDERDAPRIVEYCRMFQQTLTNAVPQPPAQLPGQVTPPPMAELAAPAPGVDGAPAPTPVPGKTWTNAQVKQFYADKAAGRYKGREGEAKALEADIFKAAGENRILG